MFSGGVFSRFAAQPVRGPADGGPAEIRLQKSCVACKGRHDICMMLL
jgi:hypothetical protein